MRSYVYVFLGGGIGAACRYWLSGAVYRWLPESFPYGTLLVNISGCFLIGLMMTAYGDRFVLQPALRVFLLIGILGGFTTFSSFSYETIALFRDNEVFSAVTNIVMTMAGCLGATLVGSALGKLI